MSSNPTFSVVIPVYNKRPYLLRALQSVLLQSFTDFEVILVDDGSTDGSLDSVAHITDSRVRRIEQPNGGVSRARNTGVGTARAPIVAFLDADDTWHSEFLAAMAQLRRQFPKAGLYASAYTIKTGQAPAKPANIIGLPSATQRFQSSDYFRLSTSGELPISASSVAVPVKHLHEIGGFPEGEKMGEDQHVWWRLCTKRPFAYDQRCLSTYHREATGRACPDNVPVSELPFSAHLAEELHELGLSWMQRLHARRYMGGHLLHMARENIRAGRKDVARRLLADHRAQLLPVKWLTRKAQLVMAG